MVRFVQHMLQPFFDYGGRRSNIRMVGCAYVHTVADAIVGTGDGYTKTNDSS